MPRHVLSAEDRKRAWTPEARERRRATITTEAKLVREDVLTLHRGGLVDGAIATRLDLAESTVARWLAGKRVRPRYGRGYIEKGPGDAPSTS